MFCCCHYAISQIFLRNRRIGGWIPDRNAHHSSGGIFIAGIIVYDQEILEFQIPPVFSISCKFLIKDRILFR